MNEFLTYEDIERAKENGVSYRNLVKRVHEYGWNKESAIRTPVKHYPSLWEQYKDVSKVSIRPFYRRIRNGMTPEEAALTQPLREGTKNHEFN